MAPDALRPADVAGVLVRLADLGPPSELRRQSPAVAAGALEFDRVLLTSVNGGMLSVMSLHGAPARVAAQLAEAPVPLEYPLVEGELTRRRRAQVVRLADDESPARGAFAAVLGWTEYVAAPIVLDGTVVGFFHGDCPASERAVDDRDAEALAAFALCFGLVYERAVLRHRLRVQRQEMRQVANWADARTGELSDRAIGITDDAADGKQAVDVSGGSGASHVNPLRDLLTRRELEVLRLMVRGETNASIARDLVVSEGTVKFHVKNVLRKLHAANRAEATSRYLRLTLNRDSSA